MTKVIALAVVSGALLALGCATGHQRSDIGVTGGYSETRLAPDTWRVLVEGNAFSTRSEIEQFLMRRCAELTLERGKRYFALTDRDAWTDTQPTESGFVTSAANEAVVTALDAKDFTAFDAVEIIKATNAATDGQLSARAKQTLDGLAASASSPHISRSQFRMARVGR
ncbi:MAG: CC0125/CC1285 family lipoprotein [Thermoanaerobaculia bacterium]